MLDDRTPVPEDGTIPDNEGAAVVATTVDMVAAAEDKTDVFETFVVLGEKVSKRTTLDFAFHCPLKCIYCVLNRFMVCNGRASLVYCVGAFYVLDGCFS